MLVGEICFAIFGEVWYVINVYTYCRIAVLFLVVVVVAAAAAAGSKERRYAAGGMGAFVFHPIPLKVVLRITHLIMTYSLVRDVTILGMVVFEKR